MGLSRIVQVLGRRWYVFAAGLLVSLGLGYGALLLVPPVYQAQGTILLMPSQEQLRTAVRNPFLQLGALEGPAGIVIARLSGDAARLQIEAQAPTAEYLVEPDPAMRGPGILVTVADRTPAAALDTLDFVLNMVTDALAQVQVEQSVPETAVVGSMRLVVDIEAERVTTSTVRALVAVLGAGVVLTIAVTIGLDSLLLRRRLLIAAKSSTGKGGDPGNAEGGSTVAARKPRTSRRRTTPSAGGQDVDAGRVPPLERPTGDEKAKPFNLTEDAGEADTSAGFADNQDEDEGSTAASHPVGRTS